MDNTPLIQALFIGSLILSISGGAVVLGGASLYDIRQLRAKKQSSKAKKRQKSPLFSVIIYVDQDSGYSGDRQNNIEGAIASVLSSSHHKYQLIVVDNNAKAGLKDIVAKYQKKHPKKAIRLVTKRRRTAPSSAIKSVLRYAKGDIVVILRPDNYLAKDTLKNVALAFKMSSAKAVIPASWHQDLASDVNLLAQFKDISLSNGLKTLSLITKTAGGTGYGIFYSKDVLRGKSRPYNYLYSANALILNSPLSGIKQALSAYRKRSISDFYIKVGLSVWLFKNLLFLWRYTLVPLFLGYGLYLAVFSKYTALLAISWGLVSFFLLFSLFGSEQLDSRKKFLYLLYIPVAYVLFFIMAFAEPLSRLIKLLTKPIRELLPNRKAPSILAKRAAASK